MERTFAFVDLAGFSALTEAHGDEAAADLVGRFANLVDVAIDRNATRVATIGDAVFLVSVDPRSALTAMQAIWQRAAQEADFPALRAGMHHGEAVQRDDQYYGTAVNLAARITAHAGGGQILTTQRLAEIAPVLGLAAHNLGEVVFKNLRDPITLFEIRHPEQRISTVTDPVCRMQVHPESAAAHLELDGADWWFCSSTCLADFVRQRG